MSEGHSSPGVSVVIPTINRANVLLDTIGDLCSQDFDNWELIIVDQSDEVNNDVLALLRDCRVPARYFKADFRGLPQARNFGWRHAKAELVLYIDDDIRCGTEFVRAHYDAHSRISAALIAGGIDELNGNSEQSGAPGSLNWWTATSVRNFHFKEGCFCLHGPGGNFSVRRDALDLVHGFDEMLTVGAALYEETEFALRLRRAGFSAWFEPDAHLLHLATPTGGCRVESNWPKYMYGLSHNRAILIFRHLRWWHRPTALLRLLLLGLSYSRMDRSISPLKATFRGLSAGRLSAKKPPLNADLSATECTIC